MVWDRPDEVSHRQRTLHEDVNEYQDALTNPHRRTERDNTYLANHRATEAAVGCPLEFCDAILLIGTDRSPESGDTLPMGIDIGLKDAKKRRSAGRWVDERDLSGFGETHLKSIEHTVAAEEGTLPGVLGCP